MTGLSPAVIAELVAEVGPVWQARQDARRQQRPRQRAIGAGAKYKLVFVNRLLATLVHLRHATTHDVLAAWFGVDRSTITRAINEIRPLLADRGCRIDSGVRLQRPHEPACSTGLGSPGANRHAHLVHNGLSYECLIDRMTVFSARRAATTRGNDLAVIESTRAPGFDRGSIRLPGRRLPGLQLIR